MMGYYDGVMIVIPALFLIGIGAETIINKPYPVGIVLASLIAAGIIAHALFVNAPVERTEKRT